MLMILGGYSTIFRSNAFPCRAKMFPGGSAPCRSLARHWARAPHFSSDFPSALSRLVHETSGFLEVYRPTRRAIRTATYMIPLTASRTDNERHCALIGTISPYPSDVRVTKL